MFLDSVWCFIAYEAVENKRERGGGEAGLKKGFPVSLLPRDSEMLVKENPELKK